MSAPTASRRPIERAGGVSAGQLQPVLSWARRAPRGPTGGTALSTLPGRWLLLVAQICRSMMGYKRRFKLSVCTAFLDYSVH